MNARWAAFLLFVGLSSLSTACGSSAETVEGAPDAPACPPAETIESGGACNALRVAGGVTEERTKSMRLMGVETKIAEGTSVEPFNRIIRANHAPLRTCYEDGLKKNAKLRGTVTTAFTVDETGAVENAKNVGGSLSDATVRACLTTVFSTLSFPAPDKGKVTVTHTIDFSVEE